MCIKMFPIVTSFLEQRELSCCLQFVLVPLQNPAPCLGNCNQYICVCHKVIAYLVEESVHVDHRPHFSHYWRGTGAQKIKNNPQHHLYLHLQYHHDHDQDLGEEKTELLLNWSLGLRDIGNGSGWSEIMLLMMTMMVMVRSC